MLRLVVVLVAVVAACGGRPEQRRITADEYSYFACFDQFRGGARIEAGKPGFCEREREAKIYADAFEKDEPVIELITMGVGGLIWERHGHIAMCVRHDPKKRAAMMLAMRDPALPLDQRQRLKRDLDARKDRCFNYGIANFHEPLGMAWGFFRGTKSFWAGEQELDWMFQIYIAADRTVYAQPLPLDGKQKQQIIDKLETDILEDNKYYAYDHFLDNCTTRIRDIIDNAADHKLSKIHEETDDRTFRDLAREGFFGMRVPLIITDIAMGRSTDRVPTYWERMFLPQYLREAVEKHFDVKPITLYERKGEPPPPDGPSGRVLFGLIILGITGLAVLARRFGRFPRLALGVAVVPYVLLGTVMWLLAIISPLAYVKWNETLLVFLPLDILLLGFLSQERRQKYARFRVAMLLLLSALDVVGLLSQPLIAPILWPLIPSALVGYWRDEWTLRRAKPAQSEPQAKAKAKARAKA